MPKIINYQSSIINRTRGVALLMVLFIIMAVTIISLGIMARSTTELASGQNMALRVEMDQLAASGLEHARGLILNPQDPPSDEIDPTDMFWLGATDLQLDDESADFYDVTVDLDDADPDTRCNYTITCDAWRQSDNGELGRSRLSASLRLDPCIAFWASTTTRIPSGVRIYGDVCSQASLTNSGVVDGDVFSNGLTGSISGQSKASGDLSLSWPTLAVSDFVDFAPYTVEGISSSTLSSNLGPYDPEHLFRRTGDLIITDAVTVDGMLLVDGDLTIRGDDVTLEAGRNMPAVYVTGDLIVEDVDGLTISGLLAVDGDIYVSAGATNLNVSGAVFTAGTLAETVPDASGNHHDMQISSVPTWKPTGGVLSGALEFDGIDDALEDSSADSYLNGLTAVTVAMWVKSDVVNQDRGILFSTRPDGADEELGFRYDQYGAGGHKARVIKASIRTTSGYTQIESSEGVQTTAWQHLALVWSSGSALKLYINGFENPLSYTWTEHDAEGLSGSVTGITKLLLGVGGKGDNWDGLIDDVRIYDEALSSSEVLWLYLGFFRWLPRPIAYWAFNEEGMDVQITADPAQAAIVAWPDGVRTTWSPAAGAFFKSITREP